MTKPIKLYNGRGWIAAQGPDDRWSRRDPGSVHVYIAAYSQRDALRVVAEYVGCDSTRVSLNELRHYFSQCWGDPMDGITPERGLWIQWDRNSKPERVL